MSAAAYLPVLVSDLPATFVFQPDGALREKIRRAIDMGCVKVIAGPTACHAIIDVKRPYLRAIREGEA